ncbi:MAG: hypothetical protein ACYTBZ_29205 [Planctomycetota bacterium]|jgi:hypothetical protein
MNIGDIDTKTLIIVEILVLVGFWVSVYIAAQTGWAAAIIDRIARMIEKAYGIEEE